MDVFFYALLALLIIILPVFVRIEGAFSFERRLFFLTFRLYGMRILSIILYVDKEGEPYLSIGGKKGKPILSQKEKPKKKVNFLAILSAIYLTKADISLYVGGAPQRVSLLLGMVEIFLEDIIAGANARFPVESCRIRALPCYVNDQFSAKFSISLFTSPVLILDAFTHTRKGVKYAKGSNRKFDGENDIRSQAND